jgi:hypothetical protein
MSNTTSPFLYSQENISNESAIYRIQFIDNSNNIVAIEGFTSYDECHKLISDYVHNKEYRNDNIKITQLYNYLDNNYQLNTKFDIEYCVLEGNKGKWYKTDNSSSSVPYQKVTFGKLGNNSTTTSIFNQNNETTICNFTN